MSKLGFAAFAMGVVACIARSNNPPTVKDYIDNATGTFTCAGGGCN